MGAKSKQTTPRLGVSTALSKANATDARLNAIIPTLASVESPSLVYLPGAVTEVSKNGSAATSADFGWTAPDLNAGQPYTVQVECFGAGGGGGGGAATGIGGGGGGGGGEYACEPNYPVIPGETYSYFCGKGGLAGGTSMLLNGTPAIPGANGAITQFDPRGKGMTGGVLANGGQGGDQDGLGVGGRGGTGSSNTAHFDGGGGGTSSAGVMSDNPVLGQVGAGVAAWYRLDDQPGALARDYSPRALNSLSVTTNTGAVVAPQGTVKAPLQVPFGAATTYNGQPVYGELQGNCWQFDHGSGSGFIGGINCPNFTFQNLTAATFSAWIKGSAMAVNAADWTDGTHSTGAIVCNKILSNTLDGGFGLAVGKDGSGNSQVQVNLTSTSHANQIVACAGPSAVDGLWHMITATFSVANNRIIIYVDGVAQVTTAPTIANIAAGGQTVSIGYCKATSNFGFRGYLSNVYLQSTEASAAYVAEAYGASVATGGSGGGASGGSAGNGNSGAAAVATSGGAAGASAAASNPGITTGSGAGGAGGNSNAAGTTAPATIPYGGGGGGAGARTAGVPSEFQLEIPCQMSASYSGLDAQGAAGGQLYTVSADPAASESDPWYNTAAKQNAICYSGGQSDSPFKGSMNSLVTFPSLNSVDANAGTTTDYLSSGDWTIEKIFLKLTVETVNASNLVIGLWGSNAIVPMLDSDTTLTAWGYTGRMVTVFIPAGAAGRQVYIDLSGTSLAASMVSLAQGNGYSQNGKALQGAGLLIGAVQGSAAFVDSVFGAWDNDEALDWYTAFHGADVSNPDLSAALEVTYIQSTSSVLTAGNGSDGYIVIKFLSAQGTPVATMVPSAKTDSSGNQLGAGFTADPANYNTWQPGTSPKVLETFHLASITLSGWSNAGTGTGARLQYRLLPGNLVHIIGTVNVNASPAVGVLFTLAAGYHPNQVQYVEMRQNSGALADTFLFVNTDGTVNTTGLGGLASTTFWINGIISLSPVA